MTIKNIDSNLVFINFKLYIRILCITQDMDLSITMAIDLYLSVSLVF